MKFFWPAPLDLIDPTFNFLLETGDFTAAKQKQQKYPHEVFNTPLYHGFVISKIYVDQGKGCRWNVSQVNRFLREGAKRFLKFPHNSTLLVMGDSGAFTRSTTDQIQGHLIDECVEVINYYNTIGVDYGLAPDNIITGYWRENSSSKRGSFPNDWITRWERTIKLAETFWILGKKKKVLWKPLGIAQGWDPSSYQNSVKILQQIGYNYIAIGGLNKLSNTNILTVVEACSEVKACNTTFHLLGVSRVDHMEVFEKYGIVSFDSSMPVRQAINDDKNNYHTFDKSYIAIRIPQTHGSPRLKQLISHQQLKAKELLRIEQASLESLRKYDKENICLEDVLKILNEGIEYRAEKNFLEEYKQLLIDKPWKSCNCNICKELGIEIVLLRNRERNLRRGFHNLYTFSNKLKESFPFSWLKNNN